MTKYIAIETGWSGRLDKNRDSGSTVEDALGKFQLNHGCNPLFVLTEEEYNRAVHRLSKVYMKMVRNKKKYPKPMR